MNTSQSKIVVLTTSFPSDEQDPSGVFIAKLLNALQRRGYRPRVLAPSDGTFHGRRTVHGIPSFRFGYFLPRSLELLTRRGGGIPENMANSVLARVQLIPMMAMFLLRALCEARHADLVYANWLGAGIVGALVQLVTRKPLVVSFRGDDGYLARDRPLWGKLTRWVARRACVIAPVSGELGRILVEVGVEPNKCVVPQFGVDRDLFRPVSRDGKEKDRIDLLFVGSLIPRKGLHDLLDALADPALETVHLTVVGEGAIHDALREQARTLGLDYRCTWMGTVSPREVADLMGTADLVCLPSYMEGRPNVVNEAMASGLPVIATRIGGIPDMVREGATALLFEPGDVPGLRACLERLAADADLRMSMGAAGLAFLEEQGVSWDGTAAEFDAIFRRCID